MIRTVSKITGRNDLFQSAAQVCQNCILISLCLSLSLTKLRGVHRFARTVTSLFTYNHHHGMVTTRSRSESVGPQKVAAPRVQRELRQSTINKTLCSKQLCNHRQATAKLATATAATVAPIATAASAAAAASLQCTVVCLPCVVVPVPCIVQPSFGASLLMWPLSQTGSRTDATPIASLFQ